MKITKRQLRRIIKEEGTRRREAPVPSQRPVPAEEFSNQAYDQGRYAAEGDNIDHDRYDADTSYAAGVDSFDPWPDTRYEGVELMRITKRQLRRIIKEEKTKIISEIIRRLPPHVEDPLFAALDQYVMVLDEEMGYDVPEELLKAEVLNFVNRYFIDSAS